MKERPILMSAPMVRAILAGRKTQTRRVVKGVQRNNCLPLKEATRTRMGIETHVIDAPKHGLCPYGMPGDRLWVKETCFHVHKWKHAPLFAAVVPDWLYAADYPRPEKMIGCHRWRPSIHMPRVASRITLEVTAVRVERLNKIDEFDASAEGLLFNSDRLGPWSFEGGKDWLCAVEAYRELWDTINFSKPDACWSANPWVWVVEFKRV